MRSTNHVRKENQLNVGVFNKRNVTFKILPQQILSDSLLLVVTSDSLLLVVTSRYKSNFNCEFKLKPITTYHQWFGVKVL